MSIEEGAMVGMGAILALLWFSILEFCMWSLSRFSDVGWLIEAGGKGLAPSSHKFIVSNFVGGPFVELSGEFYLLRKASISRSIDLEFSMHEIADLSPDAEATDCFKVCLLNGGFRSQIRYRLPAYFDLLFIVAEVGLLQKL